MSIIRLFLLFIFASFSILSAQTKDHLIVSSPEKMVIYNQFEQTLSESVKKKYGENAPFLILNIKGFLSDGLTPVIEAAYLNEKIYILRDEKGNPSLNGKATVKKITSGDPYIKEGILNRNCTGETFSGRKLNLKQGSKVKTSFIDSDKIYAGAGSGNDLLFLFINKKDFDEQNKESSAASKLKIFSAEHLNEMNKLSEKYNSIFRSVYNFTGNKFGKEIPAPEITVVSGSDEIKIRIKNYNNAHFRSLSEFYNNAEKIIAGCDYRKTGSIENTSFRIKK